MDVVIGLMAFSVIVLFLGALNYFLGRNHLDMKSQCDTINQQQSNRSSNRRKHARNANKKQQQQLATTSSENLSKDERETESFSSETKNEDEEFEDPMIIEETVIPSPVEDQPKPILPVKQNNKTKSNSTNSKSTSTLSDEESILSLKQQVNIAPVKQSFASIPKVNVQSTQDKHSKSNEHVSPCDIYSSYSGQRSLPPRFQQQQRQRRSNGKKNSSSSPSRQSDFLPLIPKQQLELPHQNGYSSESDNLTESSSTTPTLSTESQPSSDLLRSLSSSNLLCDELISIFDTTSFSSDELELILNKLTTKHLINKQTQQRFILTNQNEKKLERFLDETYRSQIKLLAIELQNEKNRISELTKTNADMEQTIRQLQQPNNNIITYQQTIVHYQMQIRRMADENARLAHQLHAYSLMPASINELKQQQIILNEQLRQISARNNHLEKEIADGQQASKHALEIYRRTDAQKQERIDQMINDINKYKKIETDLNELQVKHLEMEKNLNIKLDDLTRQRDDLIEQMQQLKDKSDQLIFN